jgi:AraC-like DNA-binding protein
MNPFISCRYTLGSISVIDGNWNWSNVVIPDNKIYLIEEGEILVEGGGKSFVAKAGDMVLIPANVVHSARLTENSFVKKSWMHFTMKQGSVEFFSAYTSPVKITLPCKTHALKVANYVIKCGVLEEPQRTLKTSMGIFELVSIFLEHALPTKNTESKDPISKAIKYIDYNLVEQFSLDFLSKKFGCSPNHFIKIFKEKTGYTPIKYILTKRIDLAKSLLESTDMPINSVMERVGFDDASYFSKTFKKMVGYSPKGYRENVEQKF